MKYFLRVLKYVRPYWKLAAATLALVVIASLVALLLPWPLGLLVTLLEGKPLPPKVANVVSWMTANKKTVVLLLVAAGLLLALIEQAIQVLKQYVHTKLEQRMVLDIRSELFNHAQRLSLAFHDQKRSGMLIYAVNFQADAATGLLMSMLPLAQSMLTLVGMFWVLMAMDWKLAVLSLTVVPFLYYSVNYYSRNVQGPLTTVRELEGESLAIVHESFSMLRVIVAFGREDHEHRRFRNQGERAVDARVRVTVKQTLFSLAVNMTTALGTALVLGYGAYQALSGKLQVGQLVVVLAYLAAVYTPLETISFTIGTLQERFVALQATFGLLDTVPEIRDKPGAKEIERARGRVTFEGVDFSYTERTDTLKGISFDAEPGQAVAIVGPTGAGKTTLMSLIPRFYDPIRGRILLDGQDVSGLTLKSLRRQISIVLQEPLLFSGSIRDNIRYGRLEASEAEIVEAARAANAHDFIARLPNGYDTELGERGAKLSGGERQRIAVARAFLKDAPILILDEPTSSIDSKTESVILEALDRLMVGRTTFMIAHRLSTVRRADVILVVDRGQIVERGAHEDLLARGGLYKQLHEMQVGQAKARNGRRIGPAAEAEDGDGTESLLDPEAQALGVVERA
jgi:ABC-type multidrug transport system fused ATPase/permease subunit